MSYAASPPNQPWGHKSSLLVSKIMTQGISVLWCRCERNLQPARFDITGPEILLMCYMKLTWDNSRWYFYGNLGILDDMKSFNLTHNVCWNKRTLLQKLNFPQLKYYVYETSFHRKKLQVTKRNVLSKEETSCHNTKPPMTENYFLSHEEAITNWYTWLSTILRKLFCLKCFKNL